jgi:hypothetical protein
MINILPILAVVVVMSGDTLTDDALIAYASKPFDRAKAMTTVLGIHHGAKVIAEFRCSDVCPDYTTRIIHYDAAPGPDCDKIGGVARAQRVPYSIASAMETFCVPAILVDRRLF